MSAAQRRCQTLLLRSIAQGIDCLATTPKEDDETGPKHAQQSRTTNDSVKTGMQAFHEAGWTREAVMNVPNAISMARLISGPFVAYFILQEQWAAALGLLGVAGASDWADGYAAKHYGQSSVLGSYLDPLADKVLVCCTVGALAQQGSLPVALASIIIGRDMLLVTGAFVDRVSKVGRKGVGWAEFFRLGPGVASSGDTDKSFEITADIPGVDKGDVVLTVDGDVLRIAVNQEEVKEEPGVRVERTRRFVERRIRLPDSADPSKISAAYDNGVLKVTVPKREGAAQQQQINVT
ncbi:HSP20-domain-containing protein [Coccomyxa subellipsoidea C-169]|uniref:HSP20-domain-containing protein n=1 Tax=Coccomyxa subellipsoidea (strain C-169) TaxID=574566 RepID=I0YYU3_COCSC|nr:HSP20-domain-containing protein [Coccomyxa subellipsoidea C-169]EIE23562.1 HSP20-domain-containing protein [Coccomyxa subellipsoidea C-169]|eukprot:XP_005648106.1 HSP20-domain-containing protein [Coccomyxa subellipsoidea C-169]